MKISRNFDMKTIHDGMNSKDISNTKINLVDIDIRQIIGFVVKFDT